MTHRARELRAFLAALATWLLVAVAAARLFDFVLHEPMWAYGNNYDQVRYTACAYVFPHRPGVDPGLYSPEAPLERYSRQPAVEGPCVWTTEYLFVAPFARWLAWEEASGRDGIASVRAVGVVRALLFLAMLVATVAALVRRGRAAAALGLAAAAATAWTDPAILLWVDTFYAEFASVIALLGCVAVLLFAWPGAPDARRRPLVLATAMGVAAIALAMGKVQFAPLPLALLLGFALASLALPRNDARTALRRVAPFALAAAAGLAIQLHAISRTDDPSLPVWRRVSAFNFAFNGVLGSSGDPVATAARIGLPAGCAALAGRTIFDYAAREEWEAACPPVFELRRGAVLARLARHEPGTLVRLAWRAITGLDPWVQRELGHVAGERYGDVTRERASLAPVLEGSRALALGVVFAPLAYFVLGLVVPALRRRFALAWLGAWLANAVIWQQILLTAAGDGVHDISRQAFLVYAAAAGWLIALAAGAVAAWLAPIRPRDERENLRV